MDPLTIGSIAAPIIGGLFGSSGASADRQRIIDAAQQAVAEYQKIGVPPAQAMQIVMQKYKSAGLLTPEMEQTISQGQTNLASIKDDPSLKAAQSGALDSLQDIARSGGMTLSDRANMEQTMGAADNHASAVRGAIEQNFRDRGQMGGTGDLLAQLQNQQDSDTQSHNAGLSAAGSAQARALAAIQAQGSLAGNVRAQDFGEQSTVAGAQDAIDRYNAANKQGVAGTNTAANNYAQQYNLSNDQRIADHNADASNYEQQYNNNALQTQFSDQMAKAGGINSALSGEESALAGRANQTAATGAGVGQGVGQVFGAAADKNAVNSYLTSKYNLQGGQQPQTTAQTWAGDDDEKNKKQQYA